MSIALELIRFLFARKKFWLAPLLVLTLLFGTLLILAQSSALGPFFYPLF